MNAIMGDQPISHVLIVLTLLSGIAVVSFKAPIRSLLAAIVQWLLIVSWLFLQESWTLGLGVLLIFSIFSIRALQFFRAMGVTATQTQHRLRYSQVVGMLGGILLGLFVALQLYQSHEIQYLYAWTLFAIGLSGVMARRNAFLFLLCLQTMFNASILLWAQVKPVDASQMVAWVDVFLVAISAYWLMGWSFFVNRLLAKRPLDIDAVHMLKN